MNDDRSEMEAARLAGLAKRHETREARAVRKQVAEEIAQTLEALQDPDGNSRGMHLGLRMGALIARDIGSVDPDRDRWLDLNRLTAIKWGSKIINPAEVVYVLRTPREIGSRDPE